MGQKGAVALASLLAAHSKPNAQVLRPLSLLPAAPSEEASQDTNADHAGGITVISVSEADSGTTSTVITNDSAGARKWSVTSGAAQPGNNSGDGQTLHTGLQELYLAGVGHRGWRELAVGLQTNRSLTVLDVSGMA